MVEWIFTHVTPLVTSALQKKVTPKPFSLECLAIRLCRNVYDAVNFRAEASRFLPITAFFLFLFLPCKFNLIPCTSAAYASSMLTVAWAKSSSTDATGYKLHYGAVSKNYQYTVDVQNNTSYTISGLAEGTTYYFAATAYDDQNNESVYSEELAFAIPLSPPTDTDGDGLLDDDETGTYGTDPNNADTDGDGMNDGDELAYWGNNWNTDPDQDGLVNLVDPDSDNDGFTDGTSPPLQLPTLEVGEVTIDHNWTRVTFQKSFTDPVVVAQSLSLNDGEPAVIRVRNVDANGFEIRVQEWDYLDDVHALEKVGFLVLDRGSYALEDGTMVEAASFETDSVGSFEGVTFSQAFQTAPVVFVTISSVNEHEAVTGRLRNISNQGFEFCIQEQEINPKVHANEIINYIAWEPSMGTVDGLPFEVGKTGDILEGNFKSLSFDQAYTNAPVFIANIQTGDGMDTANVRSQNKNANTVEVRVDEEQSKDDETSHTTEVLGYMAFAATDLTEDSDADGLSNVDEQYIYETDPNVADTDGDGLKDGEELAYWGNNWSLDYDSDGYWNILDPDSDGDGFTDGSEVSDGYDPSDPSDPSSHPTDEGLDADFDLDEDGFSYASDAFNNTGNPNFSSGSYEPNGGLAGGGLSVFLGPGRTNGATSGGWSQVFSVGQDVDVQVTVSFRLLMDEGYESNEFGEAILEIDGIRHGNDVNNSLVHVAGNGNGGGVDDTGWLTESFTVSLSAGTHTLVIGAYNNNATYSDESVEMFIDDVAIVTQSDNSIHPIDDGLDADFDLDEDGFSYASDAINNTDNPDFSTGSYEPNGGLAGGGLRVFLGPGRTNGATSGGWSRDFSVGQDVNVQVTVSFRLLMNEGYESNEFGEAILEIDGIRHGNDVNNSLVHVAGNGNGGGGDDTGWLIESFTVPLSVGTHTLVIGAYNNNATYSDESVEMFIDDVAIVTQ